MAGGLGGIRLMKKTGMSGRDTFDEEDGNVWAGRWGSVVCVYVLCVSLCD